MYVNSHSFVRTQITCKRHLMQYIIQPGIRVGRNRIYLWRLLGAGKGKGAIWRQFRKKKKANDIPFPVLLLEKSVKHSLPPAPPTSPKSLLYNSDALPLLLFKSTFTFSHCKQEMPFRQMTGGDEVFLEFQTDSNPTRKAGWSWSLQFLACAFFMEWRDTPGHTTPEPTVMPSHPFKRRIPQCPFLPPRHLYPQSVGRSFTLKPLSPTRQLP